VWVARNIAVDLLKLDPWPDQSKLDWPEKQEYAFFVDQDGEQRAGSYFNDAQIDVHGIHGSSGLVGPFLGTSLGIALPGLTSSTEGGAMLRHGHQFAPCAAWISHHEGGRDDAQRDHAEMRGPATG
jgi:hypothetical protein